MSFEIVLKPDFFKGALPEAAFWGRIALRVGVAGLAASVLLVLMHLRDQVSLIRGQRTPSQYRPPKWGPLGQSLREFFADPVQNAPLSPDAAAEYVVGRLDASRDVTLSAIRYFSYAPLLFGLMGTIFALRALLVIQGNTLQQIEPHLAGVFAGTLAGIVGSLLASAGGLILDWTSLATMNRAQDFIHRHILPMLPERRIGIRIEDAVLTLIAEKSQAVAQSFSKSMQPVATQMEQIAERCGKAAEAATKALSEAARAVREAGNLEVASRDFKIGAHMIDSSAEQLSDATKQTAEVILRVGEIRQSLEELLGRIRETAENLGGTSTRVSGIDPQLAETDVDTHYAAWEQPPDILFTKEANDEQFQIAARLERHKNVLVQGPPGTGKTHTIANLVGHLLAHGKRVLITALTSKALRVVRDMVVEPLQTLCVSVLDNETESRKQLEASVDAMVARLTSDDPVRLDREGERLEADRRQLIVELSAKQRALVEARQDEYRVLIVGGSRTSPSDAARFVPQNADRDAWIPGPAEVGVPAPVSDAEVRELYSTSVQINAEVEVELRRWRPEPGMAVGADEFARESERWRQLQQSDMTTGSELWSDILYETTTDQLALIQEKIRKSVELLKNAPEWKLDALAASLTGRSEAVAPWGELTQRLERLCLESQHSASLFLDYRCRLGADVSPEIAGAFAREIHSFLETGRKLSSFRLMTKPTWRKFIATARVNDNEPETLVHFSALETFAALQSARCATGTRWTNQITRRQGPAWEEFGEKPEAGVALLIPTIRALLDWYSHVLQPLTQALQTAGFNWTEFINSQEVEPADHMELRRLVSAVIGALPTIVGARINLLELKNLDRKFQRWNRALFSADATLLPATAVLDLRKAVSSKDYYAYDLAYRRLADLHNLAPIFQRREELIQRVQIVAPAWATAINNRIALHNRTEPPGSASSAWKWRQFVQELDRRASVSMREIQDSIHGLNSQIQKLTARLIEVRSWSAQCKRVGLEERQALQGWKDINRRIGRGTGQRVPGLRAEARRTLAKARNAVPVWIMPLARVAETFDPRTTRFDVVIVDEASQCDVMGLLPLYLAERAVVVGDHEQVSPLAIGQQIAEIEHLIAQHLTGIPNNKLYDGKLSLYDLARQSFGGLIRLLEHFRCVPEIISFSNALSYRGDIKPLRDSTTTLLSPSVIAYCASGLRSLVKTNIEEARSIAALVQAAMEQPEYVGKAFGAVSLLGEEQAIEIERLVREISPAHQLAGAKFLCGTAAQFQGDERDVVFISMVDSPEEGPLRMRQEDLYRQRFNVAASRAKDQLWVVHSLDPRRDLQPGDLRRRLIEHAENPGGLLQQELAKEKRTESEFERRVLKRLLGAGFRVKPQWVVGHYRIDLVVESGSGRRAVECDGDRFHSIDNVADDMARQSVLERVGWRFVRIRGSQFFRDPDLAMKPVFERLSELGIQPEGAAEFSTPSVTSDLADRVKRRAAEILHERDKVNNHG
jgi:very-short-patch-repair endonuclease